MGARGRRNPPAAAAAEALSALPALPLQASEYQSHRWTIYMRSPTGEDLQHVLKKVTFGLHESFTVPKRDIEFPPYELTEVGWGEFDIVVTLHFHVRGAAWGWALGAELDRQDGKPKGGWQPASGSFKPQASIPALGHLALPLPDACLRAPFGCLPSYLQDDIQEAPVELYHRLKLYDDTGAANPKKPVSFSTLCCLWGACACTLLQCRMLLPVRRCVSWSLLSLLPHKSASLGLPAPIPHPQACPAPLTTPAGCAGGV
jgi:hypothetical protein